MTIVMRIFGLAFIGLIVCYAINPKTTLHKILAFDVVGIKGISAKIKDDIVYMWNNNEGPGLFYNDQKENGSSTVKSVLSTIWNYTFGDLFYEITVKYHSIPEIVIKGIILCVVAFIVYKVSWWFKIPLVIAAYIGFKIFG